MSIEDPVYLSLRNIVGENYVSNRQEELFLYARDLGTREPGKVDYVVMAKTVEEVQAVVRLAGENKIPIVPLGGGLSVSGLAVPCRGGIVLDMKRMDAIIEVNATSRYVLMEAGVSVGKLLSYLNKYHPELRFSLPDAPPAATVTANALIYGSGHLSRYGAHSEMINGLEVVLPTAEVCRIGSCAVSPFWFSKSPLPDISGLFINWFGTTGVVTKLSLKLFPRHRIRDLIVFAINDPDVIPEALQRITATEMMEDLLVGVMMPEDGQRNTVTLLLLYLTADSRKEFQFKQELFVEKLEGYGEGWDGIVQVPKEIFSSKILSEFMGEPKYGLDTADSKKGGGFDYVGANLPLELIPTAYRRGVEIARKYGFDGPHNSIRNIGMGHAVIFTFIYPFNRADPRSMQNSRNAIMETSDMILDIGGLPWKPAMDEQRNIIKKMDPVTFELMNRIRSVLDPSGIMNPGNWEAIS